MHKARIKVYGADCPSCSSTIERIVKRCMDVKSVRYNFLEGVLYLEYEGSPDFTLLLSKLSFSGYRVLMDTVLLSLSGRGKKLKEEFLASFQGALSWSEEEEGKVRVKVVRTGDTEGDIILFFSSRSVDVSVLEMEGGEEAAAAESQMETLRNLVVAVLLTFPLLWGPHPYIQVVLGTLTVIFPSRRFYRSMIRSLKSKSLNMDTLVSLSTTVIYLYSTYTAFTQREDIKLYFLCQGVLVSLLLFGRYLECVVKGETTRSMRRLMNLIPRKTRVIGEDGSIIEKDISEVDRGARIVLEKGERIPLDGIISDGNGVVDESVMTGESELVAKKKGSPLISGTVIRDGRVIMLVTSKRDDSALGRVIEIVRNAESGESPVRRKADKAASVFIPVVIVIALFVFLLWYFILSPSNLEKAVLTTAGVLVVACPCAFGLAIPTSIMVGCGRAAEMGILFKNTAAFSLMGKIDTVAVDKTGTLTTGVRSAGGEELRPGAEEFTAAMKKRGLDIVLISGDTELRAKKTAERLGIESVYCGVKSSDKADIIKELEEKGRRVLMIGDGVNDAPALSISGVGISIENGTEIAKDTADIIILNDEINKVEDVFQIAEKVSLNVRENLIWALLYNAVAIPLASLGFMNPSIASATMSFSSIAVLLNSLKLRKMEVRKK